MSFNIQDLVQNSIIEIPIEGGEKFVTKELENGTTLENLLVKPNVTDDPNLSDEIMEIVNTNGVAASKSIVGTKIVEPGMIQIVMHNGKVEVVGHGRWLKLNPRASWGPIKSLSDKYIHHETLSIIRIPKGEYGLAIDNGKPLILAEGIHVRNSRLFNYVSSVKADQEYINHETIHIIRLPLEKYAFVIENNIPKVLEPGFYVTDSNYFKYVGTTKIDNEYLNHQTIHIIRVPKSCVGLVLYNNKPYILEEGKYIFNSPLIKYIGKRDINEDLIKHNTITRFRVKKSEIALAWYNSKPIFIEEPNVYQINDPNFIFKECVPSNTKLITVGSRTRFIVNNGEIAVTWYNNKPTFFSDPGIYEYDDPKFIFVKFEQVNEKFINLGSRTRLVINKGEIGLAFVDNNPVFIEEPGIHDYDNPNFIFKKVVSSNEKQIILGSKMKVIVYDGEVGVSYNKGKLCILQPDTYIFNTNDLTFTGFISTKQQSIKLVKTGSKDQFLRCDTKDFVEVGIEAAVFFRICDPALVLTTVGGEEAINNIVRETSIATLQGIIRSSGLNQLAQSKVIDAQSVSQTQFLENVSKNYNAPSAPIFFDQVHDEFISKLHDTFKKQYGIEISNIRIEDFSIMNEELSKNISDQAITTAQTQTKLTNLESQKEIATAEQERLASVNRIKAEADALKLKTETNAKNDALINDAETKKKIAQIEAEALMIKTESVTNAKALEIKRTAEAEANAMLLKAEVKAKSIEMEADAEKKRANNLDSSDIGKKLAILELQTNMVKESLTGIQKIVYLPPGSNMGTIPVQLLNTIRNDLSIEEK